MRDLYKVANFPVIEDIFGQECYVKERRWDEKFGIELCFGRPVNSTMGAKRVIFTSELKDFILKHKDVPLKEFNDVLKIYIVMSFRRKLKANPCKNYQEWIESTDPSKPKEITFLNVKENPEYLRDHLGIVYILLSAVQMPNGIVFPMGISKDIYLKQSKKTKKYIFTSEVVQEIKRYLFYPLQGKNIFPFSMQTFYLLRKELGYTNKTYDDINLWLAAHVDMIYRMRAWEFTQKYASNVSISKNTISSVKTSLNHLKKYSISKDEREKNILSFIRKHFKKNDKEGKEKILEHISSLRFREDYRAFKLLKLAKIYKHPIPKGLGRI